MTPPPKYPYELRAKVVERALELGNVKKAWREAKAGQIQDVPPIDIAYPTVAEWVKLHKIDTYEQAAQHDPAKAALQWAQEASRLLETQGTTLLTRMKKGTANPHEIIAYAKARREVAALAKSMGSKGQPARKNDSLPKHKNDMDLSTLLNQDTDDAAQDDGTETRLPPARMDLPSPAPA